MSRRARVSQFGATILFLALCAAVLAEGAPRRGFETYVGYRDMLEVTSGVEWADEADGSLEIAGCSRYSDVIVIASLEGFSAERHTKMTVDPEGNFRGTVWLLDGPGWYRMSVATRPPGRQTYAIVCSFTVRNTALDTPLAPIEYAGYGADLTIESPRGGANVLKETLTVRGWSRYARVRAAVEHLETGEVRTYSVRANADGTFVFQIPLEVGFGPCEVKLSSLQVDAETWRGAAVYNVVSAMPSVYMTEPAYQYGTILATGRFRIRGMAPDSPTVIVETTSEDGAKTYWGADVAVMNGTFEAWVDMPPGATAGDVFQLRVSMPGAGVDAPGARRTYTVAVTPRRPDPKSTESWVAHSTNEAIRDLATAIVGDQTDHYEIVQAIHDWVARNIAYDVRGAKTLKPGPVDALSTLARRESVCAGYANLMAALLRAAGLRVWVLIGNADNGITVVKHAWNEVEVNGRIVAIDATWDSGGVEGWSFVRRYSRAFFDPRPDQLAFTHFEDR
ncbi:MAG: hypothetical protein KA063_02330 [Firmicutes bacterium]|nr:hypothetical protein [Bacillota bacterium]